MAHVSGMGAGGRGSASARKAKSTACSGRASGRIAGHCAIMVGSWMTTQACSVRQPSSFGSPGPNSPVACPSAMVSASIAAHCGDNRRSAASFVHGDLHYLMHPRLIGHLVAHQAMQGQHHRRDALGGGSGTIERAARRLQRFSKEALADRLAQRLLGGEKAIDIGARHARFVGDVGDRRARPELAEQVPGDGENAAAGLFGGSAFDMAISVTIDD